MSNRIKAYFRSLLCRAASWFKYRRPVLVRRYVVIERDTLQEELGQADQWMAAFSNDSVMLSKRLNEKIDECDSWREAAEERQEKIEQLKGDVSYLLGVQDELQQDLRSERSAAAAQIKSVEGQLNSAIIEAAELQKSYDAEHVKHTSTCVKLFELERKYGKLRRSLEDVKKAVEVAS